MTRRDGVLLCSSVCAALLTEQGRTAPEPSRPVPPGARTSQKLQQEERLPVAPSHPTRLRSSWQLDPTPAVPQPGGARIPSNPSFQSAQPPISPNPGMQQWQPLLHAKQQQQQLFNHDYQYPREPRELDQKRGRHVQFAADMNVEPTEYQGLHLESERRHLFPGVGRPSFHDGGRHSYLEDSRESTPYHSRESSYSTIV